MGEFFYFLGGAVIFTLIVAGTFYGLAGVVVFLGNIFNIEDRLIDIHQRKIDSARKPAFTPVKASEPEYIDGVVVDEYLGIPARVPQTSRLFTTSKKKEWRIVDNFCVCPHCGTTNGWTAGVINICYSCRRSM